MTVNLDALALSALDSQLQTARGHLAQLAALPQGARDIKAIVAVRSQILDLERKKAAMLAPPPPPAAADDDDHDPDFDDCDEDDFE